MNPTNPINIKGLISGAIGCIVEMHACYYHKHWEFGPFFEAKVATELAEFIGRFDEQKDGFWTACSGKRVQGSIAIDGIKADSQGAHLRWYIVSNMLRGQGIGRQLISIAMQFCREQQYKRVFLWTFKGLDPAKHLYEKNGFELVHEQQGSQWGTTVTEQKYICKL